MSDQWEHPWTGKMPEGWALTPEGQKLHPAGYEVPPPVQEPKQAKDESWERKAQPAILPQVVSYTGKGMLPAPDELYGKPAYQQAEDQLRDLAAALQVPADAPTGGLTVNNPKHAAGSAKAPLHLVPGSALVYEALVFELGAKKYGPFNWRDTAVVRSVYLDAAMRHLLALMDGQDVDEESGQPHEAHVRACMAIILDARELGKLIDDRNTPGPVADVLRKFTKPRGYPHDGAR